MSQQEDNGTSKVFISVKAQGKGRILFHAGDPPPLDAELPFFLVKALTDWQLDNPTFRVRNTLGVVANGQTSAVYVWYDE